MNIVNDRRRGLWSSRRKYVGKVGDINRVARELKVNPVIAIHSRQRGERVTFHIIDDKGTWQCDVMFLLGYRRWNEGYSCILNCIEVNSRKLVSFKMKKKNEAVRNIKLLVEKEGVVKIVTDLGSEFKNRELRAFCERKGIELYHSGVKTHLGVVERVNRTIRELI